jgi:hypothetical protein
MTRKLKLFGLVTSCILSAFVGVALGAGPMAPCISDANHTCQFSCRKAAENWIKSDDPTQIPYCEGVAGVCNPSLQQYSCQTKVYGNSSCSGSFSKSAQSAYGCQ